MFDRFRPHASTLIPLAKTVAVHAAVATIVIVVDRKLQKPKNV